MTKLAQGSMFVAGVFLMTAAFVPFYVKTPPIVSLVAVVVFCFGLALIALVVNEWRKR